MIPEKALKLAMDAGWQPEAISENITHHWFGVSQNQTLSLSNTALDATFWQCLGKALGWPIDAAFAGHWHDHSSQFCSLILTGGDLAAFWEELLATSTNA